MEGSKDALNGITFDGKPSGYRDFRRKTLLAIAGLEDKHSHLAGPRLLSRLSGEAWRATEHLNISQLRSPEGFMIVIRALDEHYKYLPETELHESIDEFLFALKRRQGEGATAFASRFRTQLARVETLISQEREMTKSKRRRTTDKAPDIPPVDEAFDSEMEHTASEGTGPEHDAASHRSAAASAVPSMSAAEPRASEPSQPADAPRATETGTAEHAQPEGRRTTSESAASTGRGSRRKQHSTHGTYEADWAKSQLKMKQMLGTLEMGHIKPRPIFPQSVLGHLFMRKYGLSREQRAQIVRSTNGSSRFVDVERIQIWKRSPSMMIVELNVPAAEKLMQSKNKFMQLRVIHPAWVLLVSPMILKAMMSWPLTSWIQVRKNSEMNLKKCMSCRGNPKRSSVSHSRLTKKPRNESRS